MRATYLLVVRACLVVGALALPLGAAGCKGAQAGEEPAATAPEVDARTPVVVAPLERADVANVLRYVADLRPSKEVMVFAPLVDRILSFPWQDGDEVRAGDEIALIRRESLDQGLHQLDAQLEALDAQISSQQRELRRTKKLREAQVVPEQAVDQLQSGLDATRAQRKALVASRRQLAVTAGDTRVTAPIAGVLANKMLEEGDMASPAAPLCRIMVVDPLKIELYLVEEDVPRVRVGQRVTIRLDAFPGRTFEGQLKRIMPYLDVATRTDRVEVELANPVSDASGQRDLKPGMYGRAELVVDERPGVVVVPEKALILDAEVLAMQGPRERVRKAFVLDEASVAHERIVRLGIRSGDRWEVLDGLEAGERVVVRGQHGLIDGKEARVVEAAP